VIPSAHMKRFAAIVLVVVAVAGCEKKATLSEAFCSDLRKGLTPMNIYGGVRDQYEPKEFADLAYGFAAISCPEQLKTNETLRLYLENWNIDPDA